MTHADAPRLSSRIGRLLTRVPRLTLLAGLVAGALVLAATSRFAESHALMINASPSLPYWAIWLDRNGTPARGDLIVFMPPRSSFVIRHFGTKPEPFGKRVLGVAGDRVTETNREFYVNDKPVALAKLTSRLGEPLALGPTGIIPKGCYFVGSEHKDGFDSRYAAIGWICKSQVIGVGRAVL
ncbi:S26 family signal peptidase [Novosphingobium aquiterrae]|uniref:S26 family signal peptidase n=1 Tax=Novosphingobium aquiterrae TaxID=624388 RepID=A0ABV6PLT1_9SPHN